MIPGFLGANMFHDLGAFSVRSTLKYWKNHIRMETGHKSNFRNLFGHYCEFFCIGGFLPSCFENKNEVTGKTDLLETHTLKNDKKT